MILSGHHVTSKPLSNGRSIIRVESCPVLKFYEAQNGRFIPTFMDNPAAFSSRDQQERNLEMMHNPYSTCPAALPTCQPCGRPYLSEPWSETIK